MNLSNPLGSPLQDPMGLGGVQATNISGIKTYQQSGLVNPYSGAVSLVLKTPVDPEKSVVIFQQNGPQNADSNGAGDRYGGFRYDLWDGKQAIMDISAPATWSGSAGIITVIEFENVKKIHKVSITVAAGSVNGNGSAPDSFNPEKCLVFVILTSTNIMGASFGRAQAVASIGLPSAISLVTGPYNTNSAGVAATFLVQIVEFN